MIFSSTSQHRSRDTESGTSKPVPSDASTDVGNVRDLAEAGRLEEERAARMASHEPDLPDRAFDRITPQV